MTREEIQAALNRAGYSVDRRLVLAVFHIARDESLNDPAAIAQWLGEHATADIQKLISALHVTAGIEGAEASSRADDEDTTINNALSGSSLCECDPANTKRNTHETLPAITIEAARRWANGPLEIGAGPPSAPWYAHVEFAPLVSLRGIATPAVCIVPCDSQDDAERAMRRWLEAPVCREVSIHNHPPINSPSLLRFLERVPSQYQGLTTW